MYTYIYHIDAIGHQFCVSCIYTRLYMCRFRLFTMCMRAMCMYDRKTELERDKCEDDR